MKLDLFNLKANHIGQKAAGRSSAEQLYFDVDLYKKFLIFYHVGDFFYVIYNVASSELEFVSKEIEAMLGYNPSEFNMHLLLDKTHPEDRPYFLNFENKAGEFFSSLSLEKVMRYKVRYDYRVRKKNGEYIRILQQNTVIEHDENGDIIRTLGVHTDVTYLKPEGKPVFSIIGLDGEPSYINMDVKKVFSITKETLTKREKEVLTLMIEGKTSRQISEILFISKETVDNHRKNMLHKNDLNNTAELVKKAITYGWV